MDSLFKFKRFSVENSGVGLKVGTDGVLLGALTGIDGLCEDASLHSCGAVAEGCGLRILDIGTGTGIIALMLAQRAPLARITGIDIDCGSPAGRNFANSPWNARLTFVGKSLADFMDSAPDPFDMIVSNPPYYDNSLVCPDDRRSAARHTDSLSYREVITFSNDFLSPGGIVSLILPRDEEQRLNRFASSFGFFPKILWRIRTTASKSPSRIIAEFSRTRTRPEIKELTILDDGGYTEEYKQLTKEFYLDF